MDQSDAGVESRFAAEESYTFRGAGERRDARVRGPFAKGGCHQPTHIYTHHGLDFSGPPAPVAARAHTAPQRPVSCNRAVLFRAVLLLYFTGPPVPITARFPAFSQRSPHFRPLLTSHASPSAWLSYAACNRAVCYTKRLAGYLFRTLASEPFTVSLNVHAVALNVDAGALNVPTVALNVHAVALNVDAVALNVPTVALNVPTVALNVPTVALNVRAGVVRRWSGRRPP
eukprot:6841706-Pyramimonas_sp.AAC.1